MTNTLDYDPAAYDAAAASLEDSLRAAYPDYKWHVPASWAALFSDEVKEAVHTGRLYVYVQHDNYGGRVPVSVSLVGDSRAVQIVGELAINTMERYRQTT